MSLRTLVFWLHLLVGVTAGAVILFMSVTGVILAFEPQITDWLERDRRIITPPADARPLSAEAILAKAREARPDVRPTALTLRADPSRLGGGELRPRGRRALRGPVPRRGAGRPLAGARRAPRGGRVASLARLARQPPAGHGCRQPGLPRPRGARGLSLVAAAVDAGDRARGHALPRRPGWPRARLQLAQRDRDLVRARAPDPDAHRRGHVLPVGQQPPLYPHR